MYGFHECVRIQRKASKCTKDECWALWCLSPCTLVPLLTCWITAVFLSTTKNYLWHTHTQHQSRSGMSSQIKAPLRDPMMGDISLSFLVHCSFFLSFPPTLIEFSLYLHLPTVSSLCFPSIRSLLRPFSLTNFSHSPNIHSLPLWVSLSVRLALHSICSLKLLLCVVSLFWAEVLTSSGLTSDSHSYSTAGHSLTLCVCVFVQIVSWCVKTIIKIHP